MKQVKAFIHRARVSDVLHALEDAGFKRVSLFDVKALFHAMDARERVYSVAFGDQVSAEVQMELFCEDQDVPRAVDVFREAGRTGKPDAGRIYVSVVESAWVIDGEAKGS